MSEPARRGLLAIDVGSSRVKFGWYPLVAACTSEIKPSQLPIAASKLREPEGALTVSHAGVLPESFCNQIGDGLEQLGIEGPRIFLTSVHAEATARLEEVLSKKGYPQPRQLTGADLSIEVQVAQPHKVGIDRLLNAVAANRLRETGRAAIVVDLGTANTVDLITDEGAFAGGAILPGITMSARVLHDSTSTLPRLSPSTFDAPVAAVGKSTHEAIVSGLYWGAVGAVSELIRRMSQDLDQTPHLFVTGGDARLIAPNLRNEEGPARHIPHMVLSGIRLAAEELS